MKENIKKTTLRYHSSIKIERPSTTWRGRIAQRMRILAGQVSLLRRGESPIQVYRSTFPTFFRVLDEWTHSTTHPTEPTEVEMSYCPKGASGAEAVVRIYRRKELIEQVGWRISPCSDGTDLTVCCSSRLGFRLLAENFRWNR